jgi:hypothetical protein
MTKPLSKAQISRELKKDYDIIIIHINTKNLTKPDYYKLENTDLKTLNDFIYYNNNEYELDSMVLVNWNDTKGLHAITGITCNKQKFVYNGWYERTIDPSMGIEHERIKISNKMKTHCPLMKYEWNQHIDDPFHLSEDKCTLEQHMNNKRLSFSFARGERMLIYVKKPNDEQLMRQYELERQLFAEHEKVINKMQHKGGKRTYNKTPRKLKPTTSKTSKKHC